MTIIVFTVLMQQDSKVPCMYTIDFLALEKQGKMTDVSIFLNEHISCFPVKCIIIYWSSAEANSCNTVADMQGNS